MIICCTIIIQGYVRVISSQINKITAIIDNIFFFRLIYYNSIIIEQITIKYVLTRIEKKKP